MQAAKKARPIGWRRRLSMTHENARQLLAEVFNSLHGNFHQALTQSAIHVEGSLHLTTWKIGCARVECSWRRSPRYAILPPDATAWVLTNPRKELADTHSFRDETLWAVTRLEVSVSTTNNHNRTTPDSQSGNSVNKGRSVKDNSRSNRNTVNKKIQGVR